MVPLTQDSGTYSGTLQIRINNGTVSNVLSIAFSVEVSAGITIDCVANSTSCATPVTGFSFAETPPGTSSAPQGPYQLNLAASSGKWSITASVTSSFVNAVTGVSIPDSSIEVQGVAQGGSWAGLGSNVTVENSIAKTMLSSNTILFRFTPTASQDSGDYSGVITLTASTL
jgi:hypothetical protein